MNDICGKYPVTSGGTATGTTTVYETGLFYVFECSCRADSEKPLRLYCYTGSGFALIGVPMPAGGELRLKKKISKSELKHLGIDDISSFILSETAPVSAGSVTAEKAPAQQAAAPWPDSPPQTGAAIPMTAASPGAADREAAAASPEPQPAAYIWKSETEPGRFFSDSSISASCRGLEGCLSAGEGDISMLAVPVSQDAPFPLIPVFLYGSGEMIGGREYVVFKIKNGELM